MRKAAKIFLRILLGVFIFLLLLIILLQTAPVQNFARKKAQAFLQDKLKTRVEIGRIEIRLPSSVVIERVYLEDKKQDTLLYGGRLSADIGLFRLLRNEVRIKEIHLQDMTAKIDRVLPDTAFNFQFIIDAFASEDTTTVSADTAAMKIDIQRVLLDNIRFTYNDTITGNDWAMHLKHFDSRIDQFDPAAMAYSISNMEMDGFTARVYQNKPLIEPLVDTVADTAAAAMPQLDLRNVNLKNIYVDYRNAADAMEAQAKLKQLHTRARTIDMTGQQIALDRILVDGLDTKVLLQKTAAAKKQLATAKTTETKTETTTPPWRVAIKEIEIRESFVQFDDENQPRQRAGMDYGHLDADHIGLRITDIFYRGDSIGARVAHGRLTERSGLNLEQFRGNFLYTPTGVTASNLLLETPGTRIQHTLAVSYPSLEAAQKDPGQVRMKIVLPDTRVQAADVLLFVPDLRTQPLFANPKAVLRVNARVSGGMNRLVAEELQIQGWGGTRLDMRGTVTSLNDMDRLQANVRINLLRTTGRDVTGFLPASVAKQFQLPDVMTLKGTVDGNTRRAVAVLDLQTTSGDVAIDGAMGNMNNMDAATYDMQVSTEGLQLGKLLKNPALQQFSARLHVRGRGLTMESADATAKVLIQTVRYNNYTYSNIPVDAVFKDQAAQVHLAITDSNLHAMADVQADLSGKAPALAAQMVIDSIKTAALNLTPQSIIYRGRINADFTSLDPDSLQGSADIIHSLLVMNERDRLQLDTVHITATHAGDTGAITVQSDIGSAGITGRYKLTKLGTVFMNTVQPYFSIMEKPPADTTSIPYDFTVFANIIDNPAIEAFVPAIAELQDLNMEAHFASDSSWHATVVTPLISMGGLRIEKLNLRADGQDSLTADIATGRMQLGGNVLNGFTLSAGAANNQMQFLARFNDVAGEEKYRLAGMLKQPDFGRYELSLSPEVLLNYESWAVAPGNMIRITENTLEAVNFMLNRNFQQFSLKTRGTSYESPLEAYFSSFHLATLAGFALSDSIGMDGTLDGQVQFRDIMNKPAFVGDLVITDFRFRNDTIGNVTIKANNTAGGNINADVGISGNGNDITIAGDYYMEPVGGNEFLFNMDIKRLNLATVEGASGGNISNATGDVTGQFRLAGAIDKPDINGKIRLRQTGFNLTMLGNYFRIKDETITFDPQGVHFDRFSLEDSTGNAATLNGTVFTEAYPDLRFDLTINARNFQAMNKQQGPGTDDLYFGKLVFSSNMSIKGTAELPVVEGSVVVEDNTDMTVVLPQQNPGVIEREGVVYFVDMDAPENDSLFRSSMARYDSLNRSALQGFDISANLEIKKEAIFSMIVDQANGDFIRMRGEGLLTGGIDKSGYVTLSGSYSIHEGKYQLTFNLLQREFEIQEGSKIVWTGEPTRADLDITAVYVANTTPLDLVADQLGESVTTADRNQYLQRLPFEVQLKLAGELLEPVVSFDIVLPEDRNFRVDNTVIATVNTRLSQIREQPNEMNKQVFALLLLNRFVGDNPFQSSGGGLTAEGLARQSASKLLTEQLNNLAANLVEGVDINFDVESYDDYSSGSQNTRTDLNVALSKRLLNDRLEVTVGSNFELEGSQNANENSSNLLGNVSAQYQLSKDGRYMVRVYRKNEYQGILDGYVIETGVGFVITLDYNRFRNLFLSKRERERRRERRRQAAEMEELSRDGNRQRVPVPQTKGN